MKRVSGPTVSDDECVYSQLGSQSAAPSKGGISYTYLMPAWLWFYYAYFWLYNYCKLMLLVIHQYMSITFNVYYNIVNVENWQALPPNVPPWRWCLDTSAITFQLHSQLEYSVASWPARILSVTNQLLMRHLTSHNVITRTLAYSSDEVPTSGAAFW